MKDDKEYVKTAVAAEKFTRERDYWLSKLAGNLEKTIFPYDFNRKSHNQRKMEAVKFNFSGERFQQLLKSSKNSDARLHIILVAGLLALLNKYTGNNDILVGTPIYQQGQEGEFINTVLTLRNRLELNMTFKELVLVVKDSIAEAVENQNYAIEVLLENIGIPYSDDNFPLFEVGLLVENIQPKKYLHHIHLNLIFCFRRGHEGIQGEVEYDSSLYKVSSIEQIINGYSQLLHNALNNVNLPLEQVDILTEEEKKHVLIDFNDTETINRFIKPIHELFQEQVNKTPDNTAVTDAVVTYRELNRRANRLAHWLKRGGISTESVVGIMMEPSVDMVVSLMGILKAGGAYLPIDPSLPEERVRYILEDSQAAALVSTTQSLENISFTSLQGLESSQGILVRRTSPRPHIQAFDHLPWPDRSLIDLRNYKNKIGMASVTDCISIQSTRGCPYQCLYCHKIWSKHHVHRSAQNIYNEILYYYKNGVTNFAFIDDCFNLDRETGSRLFQLIIKNKLTVQLFFPNGLRGDIMTPDYIDLMVEAGTRGINLSLETASPRLQKLLKKNLDLDKFKQVVNYIARRHPHVILEMASMHGFPGETQEEAHLTLDFIKNIKWLHFPYIHILKIFSNTEMETFALEQGISKEAIMKSKNRAFHELPETLPFPKSFTRKFQADFLNDYFLNKERLMHVLPFQMKVFSETALVQKYNAYLPTEIKSLADIITFAQLKDIQVPESFPGESESRITIFDQPPEIREMGPAAKRILFLDLSQHFSSHRMLYRVVEQPLGLIVLLTYLKERFGDRIDGRIYKAGNDFDNYQELKALVEAYKPDLVGIRTLTFFQEFFHQTVSLLRQWGVKVPIITGGPYASSDYDTLLKDTHVDLVVLGEGEYTCAELVDQMLKNDFKLPGHDVLNKISGIAFRQHLTGATPGINRQIILLDQLKDTLMQESPGNPQPAARENNLAYVMYTSGTTGKPKGVMVEHPQVNNCISWMQDKFDLGPGDVIVNRTNLTFDPSVWEIFWPLYIGGSVKVLDRHQRKDAEFLIRLMTEDASLTMMYCPATLVNIMTYLLNTKEEKPHLKLPWLIIGAEAISRETVAAFYRYYQGKIVNTYGPTECTINNTYYEIPRDDSRSVVPIGKPVANNWIYILDDNLHPVHIKITGEIWIAGASIARGYLNKPQLTVEKFYLRQPGGALSAKGDRCRLQVQVELSKTSSATKPSLIGTPRRGAPGPPRKNFLLERTGKKDMQTCNHASMQYHFSSPQYPITPIPQPPHSTIYRTGDMGRWLENGTIEIMGRVDEQIKIRGYRIEPTEIEKTLLAHPLVKESVVVVRDSQTAAPQVKRCGNCGITTQYPHVTIDAQGVCNICELYRQYTPPIDGYFRNLQQLEQTIREINEHRHGRYDCLLLYAGGKGAAYALYRLVEMGIKVLAATYDHGYFGKAHLKNIKKITTSLGVDHVVLTHSHSDQILGESIKIAGTVCRGCFHTSSSLAAEYAYTHHIPVVVGATLSRGQIIENKLLMFLQQGITDAKKLEKEIANWQRSAPAIDRTIFAYIDIGVVKNGALYETVKFLDFYRYCNVSNGEMSEYLDKKDPYWKTRKNDAIYSTNCPIKQIGDYGHLQEKNYHYYGAATSWEKRLGHITLENLNQNLKCTLNPEGYEKFLKRIGYHGSRGNRNIETNDKYLCAYMVYDKSITTSNTKPSVVELRDYLSGQLPDYMIPSYFEELENIPLTANGKVDKRALPQPKKWRSKVGGTYVTPKSDMEKIIANIWKQVLHLDAAGVNDNFFDLGGSSLDIVMMGSRLKEEIHRDIPVVTLFTYPTIHSLARYLGENKVSDSPEVKEIDRLEVVEKGKNMMKQAIKKIGMKTQNK